MPTDPQPPIYAPEQVIGHHGCSAETARKILAGESFTPSTKIYDWLGVGVYFWEYGPYRAREWAQNRFGADAAVLEARIDLGNCLNLLDIRYFSHLQDAYVLMAAEMTANGIDLRPNIEKRHFLDHTVVEWYCKDRIALGHDTMQTVRGCYPEGEPVFSGSRILRETHVQVAVRDISCILALRLVTL